MKKMLLLFIVILLVSCDGNLNQETETVVEPPNEKILVGVMNGYNPYIIFEDGNVTGPYIDIVTTLLSNLNYEYELVALPWSRLVSAVDTGAVDFALPFFDKAERRAFLNVEEEPIGYSQISIIGLSDNRVDYKADLSSLSPYTIGVVQDYFYSNDFSAGVESGLLNVDSAISSDKNIDKLLQGRVDLIIEDPEVVNQYLRTNQIEVDIKVYEPAITKDYNHIVYTKTKDMSDLRLALNQGLKDLKTSGGLYEIYSRYEMQTYVESFRLLEEVQPVSPKYYHEYNDEPLRIGVLGDTKPYAYFDGEVLKGFNIDLLTEVLTRIGVPFEFVDLPFSRILEELKTGSLDIGVDLYLKEERQVYAIYPELPFAAYPTVLFKRTGDDISFTGDIMTLKPYTIGYVRDYSLGTLDDYKMSSDFTFVVSDSAEQNMESLLNERVDLIIDIKSTGQSLLEKLGKTDAVEALDPAILYDFSYVVFSKKNNLEKLVKEYEIVIDEMFDDGTIKLLSEKYNIPYLDKNELKQ